MLQTASPPLDPKWKGRIVKGRPDYSGTILTATFQIARDLGWSYFEKFAEQNVVQVQSAFDPPKRLALGESAVQTDGPFQPAAAKGAGSAS